jgi:hypothetical protein
MKAWNKELTMESICWNDGMITARKKAIIQPTIKIIFHIAMALNDLLCRYFSKYFV